MAADGKISEPTSPPTSLSSNPFLPPGYSPPSPGESPAHDPQAPLEPEPQAPEPRAPRTKPTKAQLSAAKKFQAQSRARKQSPSIKRWIIFVMCFGAFIFMISSSIAKNINKWFVTTKKHLTFQFSCNKNPFPSPTQDLQTTAESPYVTQLSKSKTFEYNLGLADFYYLGSAKSYQLGGNTQSIPSLTAIKSVLKQGARVIELDIFPDYTDQNKPIIRGYKPTMLTSDNYLLPKDCFNTININAWKEPYNTYPLILYLNLHNTNKALLDNLALDYRISFATRMIDPKKYGNAAIEPGYILMKDCKSKIVLMVNTTESGTTPTDTEPLTESPSFDACINCISYNNKDPKKAKREVIELYLSETMPIEPAYNKSMYATSVLNLSNLLEHNKTRLSISKPEIVYNNYNMIKQDYDLKSYDIVEAQTNGCQINLFHFNKVDTNFNRALTIFKDSPIILRPQYTRNMPKQGVDIVEANPATSFKTQKQEILYNGKPFNQFGNF